MPPLICRELSKLDRIRNLEDSMGLFVIQSTNRSLLIIQNNIIYSSVTHRISYNERGVCDTWEALSGISAVFLV